MAQQQLQQHVLRFVQLLITVAFCCCILSMCFNLFVWFIFSFFSSVFVIFYYLCFLFYSFFFHSVLCGINVNVNLALFHSASLTRLHCLLSGQAFNLLFSSSY